MVYKIEALKKRLARLENLLSNENERLTRVTTNIPWGAGMRRTKCTPSFRRQDELNEKISILKLQIVEMINMK